MKISEKRVTRGNIRGKVRDWLDTFQIQAGPLQIPGTYFTFGAMLRSTLQIWVGRSHALPGYLSLVASIGTAKQAQIFNALTSDQKNEFWRKLFIETPRSRISVTRNTNDPNTFGTLTIEKLLPITNDLSESMFIEAVRAIDLDAHTLYWTLELLLDVTVTPLTPPISDLQSLTPPAPAGPTGPAGPMLPSPTQNTEASPH